MAHEQIALPMAWHRAIGHLGWALVDAHNVLHGAGREADLAGPTEAVAPPQVAGEFSLEGPTGQHIEIGVDGFVRDTHRRVIRIPLEQPVGNLLGRPPTREQPQHRTAQPSMGRQFAGFPGAMGPPLSPLVSRDGSIGDGAGVVTSQFARQCTWRSLQRVSRGPKTIPRREEATEFFPFHESQASVPGHVQLPRSWMNQDTGVALAP